MLMERLRNAKKGVAKGGAAFTKNPLGRVKKKANKKKQFMQQRMRDNTDVEMAPIRKAVRK